MEQTNNKQPRKKISKSVSAIIIALLFVLTFVGGYFSSYIFNSREKRVLGEITAIIKNVGYVVDENTGEFIDLDAEDFADAIVEEFLDIHSAYYTAEEYELIKAQSRGQEQGVGMVFGGDALVITKVKGNSPAEKAGFIKDDKLLKAREGNGATVEFSLTQDAINFMKGCDEDSVITFTVSRNGQELEIPVIKSEYITSFITYYDSEAKYYFRSQNPEDNPEGLLDNSSGKAQLPSDTAYIVFDGFDGDCVEQLEEALNVMKERGRSKLILDITENGGGQVSLLCDVASFLISNGGKGNFAVAYAKSKSGMEKFSSGKYRYFENITDIAVIASENSASASECLIGALKFYGGAFNDDRLIIEKNKQGVAKTYGKGIMQTTYLLASGGALKLTTAKIFLPDQTTSIHGEGFIASGLNAVERGEGLARAIEVLA